MSLLEYPSVRSTAPRLDELEDAFVSWVRGPTKPDLVELGHDRHIAMMALAHQLEESPTDLTESACAEIGLPPGATIAAAVEALLHAVVDPQGPRCRSFRSASYYLRGLALLDAAPWAISRYRGLVAANAPSHSDVR
ncbi:MAG: hypothetical protein WD011_00805 [Nitriliruptoraceae bacterium]